ncbi:MAG: LysM peptidoglycan-binding domain-containing protein [Phycisphaerae bacterium]
MRRQSLFLVGLSALLLFGCENKQPQPDAHHEEPYTPGYASLDSMDAEPAPRPAATYEPPPTETTADSDAMSAPTDDAVGSDELLAPAGGRVYTVQKGDTLYKLARRFYNDQARWRDIWEANKTRLPDPDKLPIGLKLIIP